MKFENNELVFILGAVDGVRCQNTEEVRIKAQVLSLVAVELENRQRGVKDVVSIDKVPEQQAERVDSDSGSAGDTGA